MNHSPGWLQGLTWLVGSAGGPEGQSSVSGTLGFVMCLPVRPMTGFGGFGRSKRICGWKGPGPVSGVTGLQRTGAVAGVREDAHSATLRMWH